MSLIHTFFAQKTRVSPLKKISATRLYSRSFCVRKRPAPRPSPSLPDDTATAGRPACIQHFTTPAPCALGTINPRADALLRAFDDPREKEVDQPHENRHHKRAQQLTPPQAIRPRWRRLPKNRHHPNHTRDNEQPTENFFHKGKNQGQQNRPLAGRCSQNCSPAPRAASAKKRTKGAGPRWIPAAHREHSQKNRRP